MVMKGLTWSSLKKHYSLIPLFVILAGGMTLSAAYLARLAFKNPDVSWRRKSNPEPWQEYADKRYKVYLISSNPSLYDPHFREIHRSFWDANKRNHG